MHKTLPSATISRLKSRRSSTRQISWNPQSGLDGTIGAASVQMSFAPSAIDYRFSGTSIYTDSLPSVTEFSALFDQYRISNVTLRIDYTTDLFNNSGVAYKAPLILCAIDHDDSGSATVADLLQYPQVITHSFDANGYTPFIASFRPNPLMDVAGSGISTGYAPMKVAPFIRTANLSIPHYGFKLAILANGASVNQVIGYFQFTVYVDMEFINAK